MANLWDVTLLVGIALAGACGGVPAAPLPAGQQVVPAPSARSMPPELREYLAPRRTGTITLDGRLDDAAWADIPWTAAFVDIEGSKRRAPQLATRVRMIWDDEFWYVAATLDDSDLWATIRTRDAVIFQDNDFEMFIDPSGSTHRYFEIELNQFGTVWDLMLTKPYRDGGKAENAWDIDGLRVAIGLDGTLNDARDRDRGWTVEMAIPWASLSDSGRNVVPPRTNEQWRVNFSRVQWDLDPAPAGYTRRLDRDGKRLAEHNWVWSAQGVVNMHLPELWGTVQFGGTAFQRDADATAARWDLRRVYYAQRDHLRAHRVYAAELDALGLREPAARVEVDTTDGTWHAWTIGRQQVWRINPDGRVFHD